MNITFIILLGFISILMTLISILSSLIFSKNFEICSSELLFISFSENLKTIFLSLNKSGLYISLKYDSINPLIVSLSLIFISICFPSKLLKINFLLSSLILNVDSLELLLF